MVDRGPSRTAQHVAAHRLVSARVEVGFGRALDDDLLARDVAGSVEIRHEGMHRYLRARTAFFDRCVVDAIVSGVDQVVILGAGYDGRSSRYAHEGVAFYEVDFPATQHDKLARLERLGADTASVVYVEADFATDDVGSALVSHGFGRRPALFVLEGVVPYLDDETLRRLLESVGRVAGVRSTLAVSVGIERDGQDRDAHERAAAFRATVASLGEPVRSSLSAASVRSLLAATGWIPIEPTFDDGLDAPLRSVLGLVLARRD